MSSRPKPETSVPDDHGPPLVTVVDVQIPVAVDQAYSYRVPADLSLDLGDIVEVPLGTRQTYGVVWDLQRSPGGGANLKSVVSRRPLPALRRPMRDFIDWVARWTLMPRGMVLRMAIRAAEAAGPDPVRLGYRRTGRQPGRSTPARERVAAVLAIEEPLAKSALVQRASCGASVVDALVAETVLEAVTLPPDAVALPPDPNHASQVLSAPQAAAAEQLRAAVAAGAFSVTLLDGVTGSGKTDVYFEAVAAALRAGRQVLILLPEIALTAQFLERFAARFGVAPAEWHSDVGAKRRSRIWAGVASGAVRVVAGARSSLFLPFCDLGLLVVDEEHEAAYKQEEGVTYQARDMAVVRARLEDVPVVLASATPSIETRVNADRGRYAHVRLPARFGGRALPALEAIDLRRNPPPRGRWIAPSLVAALRETLARGEQGLLFLNRRGYAPLTLCRICGHRFRCRDCSAWLVEHRFRAALVCHHCGHAEPRPKACPECQTVDSLVACGPGVERLAEDVIRDFPQSRVLALSSDLAGPGTLRQELAAVATGQVDIVIGTQLVAKGHHFPHLTLVGVIDADVGLANGDPRAAERTFQMLQQVTGRAGRGVAPGRGLIQTYQPGHPVIVALLSGETERFYATEIQSRSEAGLPPFGRLAAIIVSGTDRHAAEAQARTLVRAALAEAERRQPHGVDRDAILVLGPAEAPLAMVRGRYRFRLLVKTARGVDLQGLLRDMLQAAPRPRGNVEVAIDVDPQSFM